MCAVKDCDRRHYARGYCKLHYERWKKHGDPLMIARAGHPYPPVEERLRSYEVDDVTGCWLWTGTMSPGGYGTLGINYKVVRAHRASYELHVGPVPAGMHLHHECETKRCVRPDHLVPIDPGEHRRLTARLKRERGGWSRDQEEVHTQAEDPTR